MALSMGMTKMLQRVMWSNAGLSLFFKDTEFGDMRIFTTDNVSFEVRIKGVLFDTFKVYGLETMTDVHEMLEEYITEAEETYLNELANFHTMTSEI